MQKESEKSKKTWINIEKLHDAEKASHEEAEIKPSQVVKAIQQDPKIDLDLIDISIDGGSVILQGSVGNVGEARSVEKLVSTIPGVKKVINHLDVNPHGLH